MADPNVEILPWDSAFWGIPVGKATRRTVTAATLTDTLSWCAEQSLGCLYFLAAADEPLTTRLLEDNGFHFTDVRLVLSTSLAVAGTPTTAPMRSRRLRSASEDDLPPMRVLAASAYRQTRFYYDVCFPREKCDQLYQMWIERAVASTEEEVIVAEVDGQVCGYITCDLSATPQSGSIGLVGVNAAYHNMGLGTALVEAAFGWFGARGVTEISVVTQARNVAAQRLYQRCGFRTAEVSIWYHKWFNKKT
jgi:dTDP-4-amino-4,6-dideoxy-D-galactose acyltransferase